jgi:membrane bound O-acyltransferase family protein
MGVILSWVALVNWLRPRAGLVTISWLLVLGQFGVVESGLRWEPAGLRMVGLIATTLLATKGVMIALRRAEGLLPLQIDGLFLFLFAWVGMEPRAFARRAPARPTGLVISRQVFIAASAVASIALAHWCLPTRPRLAGYAAILGVSLILHFSVLRFAGAALRRLGYGVREPFDRPIVSTSLAEFWVQRWNPPFIELGSLAIYRPLQFRYGRAWALFAMFLVSGLLHEMAISVPVQDGYGGPLAYFSGHGLLVLLEEAAARRGLRVGGFWGRIWTFGWLVLPLPVLFHQSFVRAVLLPLIGG